MTDSFEKDANPIERMIALYGHLRQTVSSERDALDRDDAESIHECVNRRESIERELNTLKPALEALIRNAVAVSPEISVNADKISRLREAVVDAMNNVEEIMTAIRAARDSVMGELKDMNQTSKAMHAYDAFSVGIYR